MPERIDAVRAAFGFGVVSGERVPSLILAVGRDVRTMPELERESWQSVEDWLLMARVTLCVLDGPGDEGFLIGPLAQAQVDQQTSWCEAVDQRGSAAVVLVADAALPEGLTAHELPTRPRGRGGVIRAAPPR